MPNSPATAAVALGSPPPRLQQPGLAHLLPRVPLPSPPPPASPASPRHKEMLWRYLSRMGGQRDLGRGEHAKDPPTGAYGNRSAGGKNDDDDEANNRNYTAVNTAVAATATTPRNLVSTITRYRIQWYETATIVIVARENNFATHHHRRPPRKTNTPHTTIATGSDLRCSMLIKVCPRRNPSHLLTSVHRPPYPLLQVSDCSVLE